MLQVNNLNCCRGERQLWRNLNFTIDRKQLLQVLGPNGAGKTSLLRILAGLAHFYEGNIFWQGKSIKELKNDYQQQLCFLSHNWGFKNDLTVEENLLLHPRFFNKNSVKNTLDLFGLTDYLKHFGYQLSQGQKQKLALACLFSNPPALLILDEPFAHLDSNMIEELQLRLVEYLSNGGILVISTHIPLTNVSLIKSGIEVKL